MQYFIPSIKNVLSTYSVLGTGVRHWVPLIAESFSLFKAEPFPLLFFLSFPCMHVCVPVCVSFQPNILLKGRRAIFFLFKFYFICLFGCVESSLWHAGSSFIMWDLSLQLVTL